MRNLLLAIFALTCYTVADKAAEWNASTEAGYSVEDRRALDALIDHVTATARPVSLWKAGKTAALARKQAAVLRQVYGITAENVNSYREWW